MALETEATVNAWAWTHPAFHQPLLQRNCGSPSPALSLPFPVASSPRFVGYRVTLSSTLHSWEAEDSGEEASEASGFLTLTVVFVAPTGEAGSCKEPPGRAAWVLSGRMVRPTSGCHFGMDPALQAAQSLTHCPCWVLSFPRNPPPTSPSPPGPGHSRQQGKVLVHTTSWWLSLPSQEPQRQGPCGPNEGGPHRA